MRLPVAPTGALAGALAACAAPPADHLPAFEATLAGHDSATAALGQWCAARGIASPATIRAISEVGPVAGSVAGSDRAATPAVRAALGVDADEPLAYRHVRLACGDVVLSDAQNWYVPARLTAQMNRALQSTQTPFGTVVAPLGFRRERGASQRGAAPDCPAVTILSHSAVLRLPDGRAISMVVECYTHANLR